MTPSEEKQITRFNDSLSDKIVISVFSTEDERSEELLKFCEHLGNLAPHIEIKKKKEENEPFPSIRTEYGLRWYGIPLGTELSPFLEAVGTKDYVFEQLPKRIRNHLENIKTPAFFRLFVSQHCHHCPAIVRQMVQMTAASEWISMSVIDAFHFNDWAEPEQIRAVPALLLEEDFRWTGQVDMEEVADVMVKRDLSEISAKSLKSMLDQGEAQRIADMMIKEEKIIPSFMDLLIHPVISVRLGAMVAMEEIADQAPKVANKAIAPLWDRYDTMNDTIKGDALYVIGIAGDIDILDDLERAARESDSDEVREAAEDAMEAIRERMAV